MRTLKSSLLFLFLTGILLTSCSKEDDGIYFNEITEVKAEYSEIELEILYLVNDYRVSIGLSSLEKLDIVSSVALSHTKYMAEIDQINHDNFSERQEQLTELADAKSVGENVAYGYTTAESVLKGWLNSESHKALIENKYFTHFGISTEQNENGRNYFTQMFIKR
jgi:uncharacterized protein YkwD